MDLDYLFALRTLYQDDYEDESDIIKRLRQDIMIKSNCNKNKANEILDTFYNSFGINLNITNKNTCEDQISNNEDNVNVNNESDEDINYEDDNEEDNEENNEEEDNEEEDNEEVNDEDNYEDNEEYNDEEDNEDDNEEEDYNTVNLLENILMHFVGGNLQFNNDLEDIVCTLDDSEMDQLKKETYIKDDNIECNICLGDIIKDQEIIKLNCEHIYHDACIMEYVKNYNYKCPTCRKEIGKPKYNL